MNHQASHLPPVFPYPQNDRHVDDANVSSWERLREAVWNDDEHAVRRMLKEGVAIDPIKGGGLLHGLARREDNVSWTHRLIDWGADINRKDGHGKTPLHWAVRMGQMGMLNVLLNRGAEVAAIGRNGETPLCEAVQFDQQEAMRALVEHGSNIDQRLSEDLTVLHWAIHHRRLETMRFFLDGGADPNAVDVHGDGPLHHVVHCSSQGSGDSDKAMVDLLMAYGANPEIINGNGLSPLGLSEASSTTNRELWEVLKCACIRNERKALNLCHKREGGKFHAGKIDRL